MWLFNCWSRVINRENDTSKLLQKTPTVRSKYALPGFRPFMQEEYFVSRVEKCVQFLKAMMDLL